MKKIYLGAIIVLPVISFSWFGVKNIEANPHQSDLIYNETTGNYYLQGPSSYANQSLEEKFLTMKSINALEEKHSVKK